MTSHKRRFSGLRREADLVSLGKTPRRGHIYPVVRDVEVQNLTVREAKYALYMRDFKQAPIEQVKLSDCDFAGVQSPNVIKDVKTSFLTMCESVES